MQFNDLTTQQNRIREKLDQNILAVMNHGQYIMGPEVKDLENRLSEYVGIKHAIACSSGTDALLLALMAYGIGPGDAIFTTPFTFIATAEVISLLGAIPVFVDIDPNTFNIDPQQLEKAIMACKVNDPSRHPLPNQQFHRSANQPLSLVPKGVIPVDLFGLPADYDAIKETARKHRLFVIEDAAQSFGAEYKSKKSCSLADIACTSFFPAKPLGCYGDGGMCFTDDDKIAEILRSLLVHGKGTDKYDNVRIGINGRLDTIQAAILNAKFDIFPEEVELRDKVAQNYSKILSPFSSLITPYTPEGMRSVWAQYSILAKDGNHRIVLQKKLQDNKIPTAIYYPKPLHQQSAFSPLGYKNGDFPVSEDRAHRIFSIPMHPYLTEQDQQQIAEAINR
jgi:UDP-2-acetamido-2-deoxy-ribo-hexuluronate aminotransferase